MGVDEWRQVARWRRLSYLAAFLFASVSFILGHRAYAEVLHNVEPLDTLGDIKKKYPNAVLTRVKAAWVTEDQDFFSLRGQGFPGQLYIAFTDLRPTYRQMVKDAEARRVANGKSAPEEPTVALTLASQSDDEALDVLWVRWVPEAPIPLERYKSKYGEPSKCEYRVDTMRPYCDWTAKGLSVALSDDKKLVMHVEAQFTRAEQRAAWLRRGTWLPSYLKDLPAAVPTPVQASERKTGPSKRR